MKLVLTMIVKDESSIIERCLNSCVDIIDSYCIVDTGSTDNTKQIIRDFFDSKGINGVIKDFKFTNFAECRNKCIEYAKELGDYGFWIDADETLILKNFNKPLSKELLSKYDQLLIKCNYGNIKYERAQFYNLHKNFYWYGPVHEILTNNSNITSGFYNLAEVLISSDGNSWNCDLTSKYENHANILLEYQNKNNWKDSRWTFYLAQSYKDACLHNLIKGDINDDVLRLCKLSIFYYKQRIQQETGFDCEVYYSQLMIARLTLYISSLEKYHYELLKCEEYNNHNRIEHFYDLFISLHSNKNYKTTSIYISSIMNYLKLKTKSNLFIEQYIYDWGILELIAISLFYTSNYKLSFRYFEVSLSNIKAVNGNENDIKRIENNLNITKKVL